MDSKIEQPEALRLAELIDWPSVKHGSEAAAELRRLHEENQRCRQVCAATAAGWREETKELLADAERYRWLRNTKFVWSDFSHIAYAPKKVVGIEFGWMPTTDERPSRESLDTAIDAAIEADHDIKEKT